MAQQGSKQFGGTTLPHRCKKCSKLLAKEVLSGGFFQVKCLRCGRINSLIKEIVKEQMLITDVEGKILFVNNELEKITGYSSNDVIGKTPGVWGSQMSKEFYQELWRIILTEKQPAVARLTNRHKSGKLYQVLLRISPIIDQDTKKIILFVGTELPLNDSAPEGDWSMPKVDA